MRRLDHCSIHVFIATCSSVLGLLVLSGTVQLVVLVLAWSAALAGVVLSVAWISAPRELTSAAYVTAASAAFVGAPQAVDRLPAPALVLLAAGVGLYAVGALVYATRRPNPDPLTFGYHELFHLLVIAGAATQYGAVAGWIVPAA